MSGLVVDPRTLRALQVTLRSTLARAQDHDRAVQAAAERTLATITDAVAVRRAKVEQCRRALERCRESERADCSVEVAALTEAQRRLAAAQSARTLAAQAVADYRSRASASLARLEATHSQGLRYLSAKLDRVLAVDAGAGGGSGGVGATLGSPAVASATPDAVRTAPGLPRGCVLVPVHLIDQTEDPISGPQDFGKGYSIEDLDYAFDLFEQQVLPGLAEGADAASFSAVDRVNGVYGTRSLADTFSGFLGGDAIRLEPRPDGTYRIANGRHRVYVASRFGRRYVPAFIAGGTS